MDILTEALNNPFTWGLLLGLLIATFMWKSGFTARRHAARELTRVAAEIKDLQSHLNTQLKINASGNETLLTELESLKRQNEALRVNNAALQQKPGRAEQRLLQIYEIAIRAMREQAPGFAPAWEKALRQGEAEVEAAESGLRKLVRRVLPGLGNVPASQTAVIVSEDPASNV
jgi:DNA anti-recombination protein RmuC